MITDEQVRIALAVWFEDSDYTIPGHAGPSTMRDMRAALEAAIGGVKSVELGEQLEAARP